jgi:hypothetical protein
MSPNCIDVERIGDVESLPEGHPHRKHVAECPRCQSLWLSYQSFMRADVGGAPHAGAARTSLEETIRRKAGVHDAPAPRASRIAKPSRWAAWLRPAFVTAVAAVLTVVAVSVWRSGQPGEAPLRGPENSVWSLATPQLEGEKIVFEWAAVTNAEAYDVQIFDDALNEVYRSGPVTATTFAVERGALPSVARGASLTWRVQALRGGDVVSTSPPSSMTLP